MASKCEEYGKDAPEFTDKAKTEPIGLQVAFIGLPGRRPSQNGPDESVRSCRSCVHYVEPRHTAPALGWSTGFCIMKGELLLDDRLMAYATDCEHRTANHGSMRLLDPDEVRLLPEYADGYGRPSLANLLQRRSLDPQEYETDKPVAADEAAVGIRAWREMQDLEGYGAPVYLPIFAREFFSEADRARIPVIGDDQHPEDYLDHNGTGYILATAWMELDETPALWGAAGVGKTELARHMAFLMGLPFTPINITSSSEVDDIVGRPAYSPERGTYFVYGRGPTALKSANVLLVDEPNAAQEPAIWQFWRPLLDNSKRVILDQNEGEIVHRHPSCFMTFAMNPAWDPRNTGVATLADADTSRLIHIYMALPPENVERQIIMKVLSRDGLDDARAKKIVDVVMACAKDLRQLSESGTIPISWGIRPQIQVARAMRFFKPVMAYRLGAADALEELAKQAILDIVRSKVES